jgi:hypothetical protein
MYHKEYSAMLLIPPQEEVQRHASPVQRRWRSNAVAEA